MLYHVVQFCYIKLQTVVSGCITLPYTLQEGWGEMITHTATLNILEYLCRNQYHFQLLVRNTAEQGIRNGTFSDKFTWSNKLTEGTCTMV